VSVQPLVERPAGLDGELGDARLPGLSGARHYRHVDHQVERFGPVVPYLQGKPAQEVAIRDLVEQVVRQHVEHLHLDSVREGWRLLPADDETCERLKGLLSALFDLRDQVEQAHHRHEQRAHRGDPPVEPFPRRRPRATAVLRGRGLRPFFGHGCSAFSGRSSPAASTMTRSASTRRVNRCVSAKRMFSTTCSTSSDRPLRCEAAAHSRTAA
jgi:hypothetical protein